MTENIVKTLELDDGYAVETVFYGSGTLCISSQAGCRMACPYCASGRKGLVRSLTTEELFRQVSLYGDEEVKRITLSGIGEPMDCMDTVEEFISECALPVSVTTSVPCTSLLERLMTANHNGVMLSLHAGTQQVRSRLVPKAAGLDDIFDILPDIWEKLSGHRRRKTGFNYLLFKGINDTDEEVDAFIRRVLPFRQATVHLLVCNPVEKSPYISPDKDSVDRIYEKIRNTGMNVRRANNWRKERKGGCGTLFLRHLVK